MYPFLAGLRASDTTRPNRNVGIVYPMEETSLEAAVGIASAQLARPILLGPRQRILDLARTLSIDISDMEILDTGIVPSEAARVACRLVKEKRIDLLMKGSLHTDELMHAAFDRENGVRTKKRVSHTFVMEIAGRDAPLLLSDCAINIQPDLAMKQSIVENAMLVAHAIGIDNPRVGILSATESILPAMGSTLDAAALRTMAARGQILGGLLDGPLALDNAVSMRSAATKNIVSDVAGQADVLIMPNLEAGNILYKSLIYFGGAECAGIVTGTQVPIVLTSRADSVLSRISSVGLGMQCLIA
jgi:phosphate acetyltransferase